VIALFVERFGIENLIFLFLADAVLFLIGSVIASYLVKKIREDLFLIGKVCFTLIFIGLASLFPETEIWFFVFAILAKDLFFSRINLSLIRQVEEFFSPTEAQKFIPVIDSAITIGTIFGAFFMVQMLNYFPEKAVLALWAGAVFGIGALILFLPKILHFLPRFEIEREDESDSRNEIAEAWKRIKERGFLRNLLFLVFFQAMLFTFIEVEFTREIHHEIVLEKSHNVVPVDLKNLQASIFTQAADHLIEFGHTAKEKVITLSSDLIAHEKLAHDLGMFHLLFGLLALVVQLLITSRILYTLGIVGSIISYFLLILAAVSALFFGFGNISILRGIQHGFHSVGTSAYHLIFYSIFARSREAVRLFFEGIVVPVGVIFAVGFMFLIPENLIVPLMFVSSFGSVFVAVLMKRNFTAHSAKSMLKEDNISAKLHHIEILGQKGHRNAAIILANELKNKNNNPIVREKLVATISGINKPGAITVYSAILNDVTESLELKKNVLSSLLKIGSLKEYWQEHAFGQHHLLETLNNLFVRESDSHLKKLVVMNIFQHLPIHQVVPFFLREIKTSDELLQAILLRSCTIFNDPATVFYLRSFLSHENSRLKGSAIIALWKFEDRRKLRGILKSLISSSVEVEKISGIYTVGEVKDRKLRYRLMEFMDCESKGGLSDLSGQPLIRLHVLIALAKLGDKRSIPGLLKVVFGEEEQLAQVAFNMLDRIPSDIRYLLQKEIQLEVSNHVFSILKPRNVFRFEHISHLPNELIVRLKRFYRLAGRYDDILMLERVES